MLPQSFVAAEIARLESIQGDIETLSARIAAVRTWSYIAHRADWVAEPAAMAERTRAIEEKLSDALHDACASVLLTVARRCCSAKRPLTMTCNAGER